MKKLYILLLFTAVTTTSIAQTEHYLGVRGGYGITSVSFVPYRKTASVGGINFGVSYKLYAEKHMGTQLELNYVQKGYTIKIENGVDTTFHQNAIEFPAMAQGFIKLGGSLRILASAGFFCSYFLDRERTLTNADGTSTTASYPFGRRDNRFEYGLIFGGGLGLEISKLIEIQAEFRYQYSLSRIMRPRFPNSVTQFGNLSTMGGSLGVYYKF